MNKLIKLPEQDRNFFDRVSLATFSNPFSEERRELDQQILGQSSQLPQEKLVEAVTQRVRDKLETLQRQGKAHLRFYSGIDRETLRKVIMFDVYHRFRISFDDFILKQKKAGDSPSPVPFATEAIGMLVNAGVSHEEALRLFAFFYQVRRAFYFIDNSLIGESSSIRTLRMNLWNLIFTHNIAWYERFLWNRMEDFSTLLLGETGTGKGAAASAIGRSGFIPYNEDKNCFVESFTRNFISINLSQYPETIIESELFGHRKGAFTGAIDNHEGIFSRCTPHGSIFLDEIGDVTVPVQIKLLQILQERAFSPVGSHEKKRFRGRVIAATNRPLEQMREQGLFRDDFYYRLCSEVIHVPPLRQRLQEHPRELEILLTHVLSRLIGESAPEVLNLVQRVIEKEVGKDYPWPGNVRELEQAARRILLTSHYGGVTTKANATLEEELISGIREGSMDAQHILGKYCRLLYQKVGTYEEVARRINLDRRTVKKYVAGE